MSQHIKGGLPPVPFHNRAALLNAGSSAVLSVAAFETTMSSPAINVTITLPPGESYTGYLAIEGESGTLR